MSDQIDPFRWRAVLAGEGAEIVLEHGNIVEIAGRTIAQVLMQYRLDSGEWVDVPKALEINCEGCLRECKGCLRHQVKREHWPNYGQSFDPYPDPKEA